MCITGQQTTEHGMSSLREEEEEVLLFGLQ